MPRCTSGIEWVRRTVGGVLAPDAAWLLLRGLRTLHVRLPRQVATAAELARRLAAHPDVQAVHYPGLPDHPEYEITRRQMPEGAGGVLAFELADGVVAGRCEEAVRLVRNATSLGGVETLIERRARIEPEGRVAGGPPARRRRARARRRPLGRSRPGDRGIRQPAHSRAQAPRPRTE